jgi:hypothetical protein
MTQVMAVDHGADGIRVNGKARPAATKRPTHDYVTARICNKLQESSIRKSADLTPLH